MFRILKRLIGRTPSVDEIVAPLARITADLEAAMAAHKLKVEKHAARIAALQAETNTLNEAHFRAGEIKTKLNNLLGA